MQRQADAAERHGQRGRRLVGELRLDADAAEAAGELARADGRQHLHGGDVVGLVERLADRHGAVIALVEILGCVIAEAHRAVLDQRLGVGEARLEGEAVDERLQRRARRAHGGCHVDGAPAGIVEIAGRADVRDHLARRVVDDEDGGRQLLAQELRLLLGKFLQRHLHVAVERQPVHDLGRRQRPPRIRQGAGRASGNRGVSSGPARAWRASPRPRRSRRRRRRAASTRSRARTRGLRVAIGAALLGRLRQRHEQCGLADGQPPRLLAEVGKGGRAHALDVAAERGKAEVQGEDLASSRGAARAAARP